MNMASVFQGGVKLEPRKVPVQLPSARLPLQTHYAVPLTTRGGHFSEPRVSVGEQVLGGQLIAGGRSKVGVHAPTSGTIEEIHTSEGDTRIVIHADGAHSFIDKRPAISYADADIEMLREAGLAGMGGAGFPTADKLQVALDNPPKLLLVNAVECEPMISCDAQLIAEDAKTLLYGADWLRRFVGAERCQIVLEDHNPASFAYLMEAQHEMQYVGLAIAKVPTRYPAGSERQLVHAMTDRELAAGARPLDNGVLVQNTATVHALGRWARDGTTLTERLVTVTGDACKNPQTLWCPIGAPISSVLDYAGVNDGPSELYQGGPVMGIALKDNTGAIAKHTQCLRIERPEAPLGTLACIRCGLCSEACPEHLLPQQLHWQLLGDNLPGAEAERLPHCILCGCCDMVCPSNIPLSQQFAAGKSALRLRQHTEQRAAKAKQRVEARTARLDALAKEKQARLEKRKSGTDKTDKQKAVAEAMARSRAKKLASEKAKQND